MGLVAMRGGPRAMPGPGGVLIAFAGRADHRRIDERSNRGKRLRRGALAHASALGLEIAGDRREQTAVEPVHDKRAAKAHEGGAFGRLFVAGKTAKAAEARPVRE
jgi:hypothetical protein